MFQFFLPLIVICTYGPLGSQASLPIPQLIDKILNNTHVKSFTLNHISVCHAIDAMLGMESDTIYTSLAGLLGRGYDPLTDVSTFYMLEESFSNCGRTPDYRFYVPDNSTIESIMVRKMDKSSVETESFKSSSTNSELEGSVEGGSEKGGADVKGKLSAGFQITKTKMQKNKQSRFSYSLENNMYRMTADRSTKPAKHFQARLKPIIQAIHKNENEKARYLVQQIIADFGTHVTTEVIIGTKIVHQVFVSSSVTESTTEIKIKAKAQVDVKMSAANVSGEAEAGGSTADGKGSYDFQMNIDTWVQGGSKLEMLGSKGFEELLDDRYPVSRSSSTKPIYMYMQSGSIDDADHVTARKLRELFEDATNEYVERNTFYGCTDSSKQNFDFQANVDDKTCEGDDCRTSDMPGDACKTAVEAKENMTAEEYFNCAKDYYVVVIDHKLQLKKCGRDDEITEESIASDGGMYQTCEPSDDTKTFDEELAKLNLGRDSPCEDFRTPNIVTNDYTCSENDDPYEIISANYKLPITTVTYENVTCIGEECFTVHAVITLKDEVTITAYWCQPKVSENFNGIVFKGYFDIGQVNNFNGQNACPKGFKSVTMFLGTTFCLSRKGDEHYRYRALLTQLYSSNDETKHCKSKHSRQLITVFDGARIYACILKRKAYYDLPSPTLIKGPYLDKRWAMEDNDYNMVEVFTNGELTNSTLFSDIGNKFSVYINDRLQQLANETENEKPVPKQDNINNFFKTHAYAIIAGVVLIILCLVAIIYACNCL